MVIFVFAVFVKKEHRIMQVTRNLFEHGLRIFGLAALERVAERRPKADHRGVLSSYSAVTKK